MLRSRSWLGALWSKPKNPHSLDQLKYLYNVLARNQTVSEANRSLLVETLRSIAEILIWGDQNDSSVFDFFLEKNMLAFFLRIMRQRSGGSSFVCVQLLQTLNILFENIRNETSLYYLLSNNHVNSIIVHKFDFSDEEVMAYYISFLKTLSLKLNSHTIHFFYNEHTNDFPLYTEAIKFFNHPESMVRIAVRTLSLNVYKVKEPNMLAFIRDRTASPYFSNIVWFIGKHVQELDACIRNKTMPNTHSRLPDLVAEHLDHLHYLNDILCLNISDLNYVLTNHLVHKLLVPLYINSIVATKKKLQQPQQHLFECNSSNNGGKLCRENALYLLSQVFLILSHEPLVQSLAWILLKAHNDYEDKSVDELNSAWKSDIIESQANSTHPIGDDGNNATDEEKQQSHIPINSPFLDIFYTALRCDEDDYAALFVLCLLYAMITNRSLESYCIVLQLLRQRSMSPSNTQNLISLICDIIVRIFTPSSKIRLITVELALKLLQKIVEVMPSSQASIIRNTCIQLIGSAKGHSVILLQNFYRKDDLFLNTFEHECHDLEKNPLNVEWLCMDSAVLLPPTGTPMTGIELGKRLPCGEDEKCRTAIRLFFIIRKSMNFLENLDDTQLPLSRWQPCMNTGESIDLNSTNSFMTACTIIWADGRKLKRYLVVISYQVIIVEPEYTRLGFGIVNLVGLVEDIEVSVDKEDSKCLHITIHRPPSGSTVNRVPLLSTKFIFDDHIRCLSAKRRLAKARNTARLVKLLQIEELLSLSNSPTESETQLIAQFKNEPIIDKHRSTDPGRKTDEPTDAKNSSSPPKKFHIENVQCVDFIPLESLENTSSTSSTPKCGMLKNLAEPFEKLMVQQQGSDEIALPILNTSEETSFMTDHYGATNKTSCNSETL